MNQPQTGPNLDHYKKVVNRLSQQIGLMTVEQSSMAEIMIEKDREIMTLKNEIADLKARPAEESATNEETTVA